MRIIRERRISEDHWRHAAEDGPLPAGDVIVSLSRWRRERDRLLARGTGLGVRLAGGDDPEQIAADLPHLQVVALEFAVFVDGRAFSQARLLREQFGYRGEIRAVGDLLRDQIAFMQRCGINACELPEGLDPEHALGAFDEFSVQYQPAADAGELVFRTRARRALEGAPAKEG